MFKKFKACSLINSRGLRAAILLALPAFCLAQQNKLLVRQADTFAVKRGAVATQTLQLVVQPGLHVNSDKPKDEFIIPLKLAWTPGLLVAKGMEYPKPEMIKVGEQNLSVFTGMFTVKTEFQVPMNAPVGPATLTGKIRYQACSSDMCFRPSSIDVKLPVVIE